MGRVAKEIKKVAASKNIKMEALMEDEPAKEAENNEVSDGGQEDPPAKWALLPNIYSMPCQIEKGCHVLVEGLGTN